MDFIRMFNLIDTDQSGEITRSELIKFMHENNFTESFVDKWLILFDFNQRGRITMDDFCERLGLVIDENMHKQLNHHRPSFINLDDLDDFVDVDDKMEQQIIHVSTNKPISTPIKRNFNSQETFFEDFPVMKEIESKDNFHKGVSNPIIEEVITKKFAFPLFGMAQSDTNPEKNSSKNEHKSHDPSEIQTNSSNSRKALSLPKSPESANEKRFNLPVEQTNSQSEIDKTHRKRANTLKSSSPRTKSSEKSPKFADIFNFSKLKIKSSENKPKGSTLNPNKTQKDYNDNNFTSKVTSLDRKKDKMNKTDGHSTSTDVQNTQNNFNTELDNEHKKNHSFVKGFSHHKRNNEKGESLTNISIIIDADKKSENQKKEKTRKSFLKLFHQKDKKSPTKEDDKQDKISKETEKTKINTEHHKNLQSENVSEIIFDNKPNSKAKSTQENRRSFLDSENRTETEPVYKEEQLKNKLDELMKLDNTNIKGYISNEENLKMKNRQEFEKEMDKMILDGKNAKHVHSKISNEEPPNNNSRHKGSKDLVSDSIERNSEELFKLSSLELNIPDYVSKIPEDKNNLLTSLNPINPADKDNRRYLNSKSPDGINKNNYPVIDPAKKDLQRKHSEDLIEEVIPYQVNCSLGSQLPDMVDQRIDAEFFANNKGWHDLGGKKRNFDMDKRFPGKRNDTDQMETTNKIRENPPKDFPDGSRNPNKLNENKENLQKQYSVENDQEDKSNLEIVESLYPEKNVNLKETESLKDDTTEEILHKSIPTKDPFSIIEEDQPGTSDPETENIHKIENESKINLENKKSSILNEDDLSKNFKIIQNYPDLDPAKKDIQRKHSEDLIEEVITYQVNCSLGSQLPDMVDQRIDAEFFANNKGWHDLDGKNCNFDMDKRFSGKRNNTDQMETTNKIRENPPKDFPGGSRNPNKLNENKENLQNQYSVENDQEDKSNLEIVESLYPEKNVNFKETESLKDDTTEEIFHKSIPTEDPFSIIEEDQPGTSDPETENIHKIENESKINLENKKSSILNEDDLSKNFKIILKDDNELINENIELEDSIRTTLQNPLTRNPFNQEPDSESSNPEKQSKPTDKTDFKLDGKICNEEIEIDKNLLKSPQSLKTGSNESRVLKENTDLNKGPQVPIDSISTETFDKNLIKNESKIRNNTDDRILLKQQLTNSSNENIVPVYSKIHRPNGKIIIIHKDFGRNDYPNLVEDVVKVYEESKTVDDWNGHELIKGYLDKYYERIWSVIIVNSAYELYVTYENMVIFKYDSFTFIIWKTIEPL